MRTKIAFVFLLLSVTSIQANAQVARKLIEKQYQRWAKAYVINDSKTILRILASDYTLTTFSGKVVPLKDYRTSLQAKEKSGIKNAAYRTQIKQFKVTGNTASVVSEEENDQWVVDPDTNTKQKQIHTHVYLDTWVKQKGVWRCRSTVTKSERTVPAD